MNNSQEHEYVDLGLPSGTLWATCNVGASKPEDYGDYFAWGEIQPKIKPGYYTYKYSKTKKRLFKDKELITKYCNRTKYGYDGFTDGLTELQASDDAAAANWGNGWYTPKKEQWDELMAHTNSEWTTRNGVKGRLFTSRKNGKSLFLPAAGGRWYDEFGGACRYGYFWSSSLYTNTPDRAWYFGFGSVDTSMGSGARYSGLPVRAVRSAQLDMNCCPEHEHVDLGLPSGTLWATCNVGASKPEDNCCPEHEYVDLGLPSGTLWATCNVGASKPEDYGNYFAWGETKKKDVYDWDTYKHAKGAFDKLTKYCDDLSDYGYNGFADTLTVLQPIDDPATVNWGNGWYTPKKEQWDELMAHTNREGTTMNGVKGWLFTSWSNGKSLFLPAAGGRWYDELCGAGNYGYFWSSSLYTNTPDRAWYFGFGSVDTSMVHGARYSGLPVRAVRSAQLDMNCCPEHEHVDLGLPSGTLWATCNVGASKPENFGDYFAWGETKTKSVYEWYTYKHAIGHYLLTKYCNESDRGYNGFADTLTELQPIDDPATANWGNGWYTPKKEQWDELMAHTYREGTTMNGVKGWLFTSRRNGNSLFLPAAGCRVDSYLNGAGSGGDYWSSSLRADNPDYAWYFDFGSGNCYMGISHRGYGRSVRPVRSARKN